MNLNSSLRIYIPFGLRGTVIGKTENKVIVTFDEQFLSGTCISGHVEQYRGAIIEPTNLLNVTKKFESQLRKKNNQALIAAYTEAPATEGAAQKRMPKQTNQQFAEVPKVEFKPVMKDLATKSDMDLLLSQFDPVPLQSTSTSVSMLTANSTPFVPLG